MKNYRRKMYFYHKTLKELYGPGSLRNAYVHFRLKYPKLPGMTKNNFIIFGERMPRELLLCNNCDGLGKISGKRLICAHKGDYEYWSQPCHKCGETGRLWKIVSYEPFNTESG